MPDLQVCKARVSHMFKLRASPFGRCYWMELRSGEVKMCDRSPVGAHSVQNAVTLELIAEGGKLVVPDFRLQAELGPQFELKTVGRHQATTFAGLCSQHDDEIFAPIEKTMLDVDNVEHRFLLAYRATFYELHATGAAAVLLQSGFEKRVELGLDKKNEFSPSAVAAVERMFVAWQTWVYKTSFDEAYRKRDFDSIHHDVIEIAVDAPTLAASGLFSLGEDRNREIIGVCFSILPVAPTRTVVLLSYLPKHRNRVRRELWAMRMAKGEAQKMEISRRLLNHCANFALSPNFVRSWSETKRQRVLDFYVRTIGANDSVTSHPDLNLFA
jgi:hypothetical protein